MRDSGDAIEKVLAGLRDVAAPTGMERRILEGLEGRVSAVEGRSGWRRLVRVGVTIPTKALICGAALAGLVAVVLAIPAMRRIGRAPVSSKSGAVTGAPIGTVPLVAAGGSRVRLGTTAKGRDAGLVRVADSPEANSADEESLARSEMEAASFPAPPMPLTAQEKLLLRLVHKVDPVEMAMLDPKFRAMQEAEEKAEFQRFFGQTATKQAAAEQTPTEQAMTQQSPTDQASPAPDQAVPAQPVADPATQDQPIEKQAAPAQSSPDQTSPDQSTTQQPTPRPTGTENQ